MKLVWNEKYDPLLSSHATSAKNLLIFRTVAAIYCTYFVIHIFSVSKGEWFIFFTVWNWGLLTVYFDCVCILGWINYNIDKNEKTPDIINKQINL